MSEREIILAVSNIVAKYYNIETSLIIGQSRISKFKEPRQVVHYLIKEYFYRITFDKIGKFTGGFDHSTVMHSCNRIKDLIKFERTLREDIENLEAIVINEVVMAERDITDINNSIKKALSIRRNRSAAIRNRIPLKITLNF